MIDILIHEYLSTTDDERAAFHKTVDCCVTSPPYFALRDYGTEGQIGLEQTKTLFDSNN